MMNIVAVYWKDPCEHINETVDIKNDDPLVYLMSIGIDMGDFTDKDGMRYKKICYKRALDNSANNDDYLVIPEGCIIKTDKVAEL